MKKINIFTTNEEFKVNIFEICRSKLCFLKYEGAAARTALTLTWPLKSDLAISSITMIQILVVETFTCSVLFQSHDDASEPVDGIIQSLTPILVSLRTLQDQLDSQLHEIRVGANIALISCHSYGGCFTLIVRGQQHSYVQIKALRKAVCQFIHVLCGLCWQRLK